MDEREARSTWKVRKIRLDEEGSTDLEHWRDVPPGERLALVWELVEEYLAWRNPDAGEQRLQRSVCRVVRR